MVVGLDREKTKDLRVRHVLPKNSVLAEILHKRVIVNVEGKKVELCVSDLCSSSTLLVSTMPEALRTTTWPPNSPLQTSEYPPLEKRSESMMSPRL